MRKLLLASVCFMALISCSKSKEDIAKNLIKENLKTTLNDFKSYEPVEFGKLDSSLSNFESAVSLEQGLIEMYKKEKLESVSDMAKDINSADLFKLDQQFIKEYEGKIDSLKTIINKVKLEFKPKFEGFKMAHKFRAKNALGATILQTNIFYFSEDLTKIYQVSKG